MCEAVAYSVQRACEREEGQCVEPLARLQVQPTGGVGDVVGLPRNERAVVLGDSQAGITIYGAKGVNLIDRRRLSLVWRPSVGRAPAGALLATIEAQRTRALALPVDISSLMSYVASFAGASLDASRLFALDALDLGRPDLLGISLLDEEERQLLYAWHEIRTGASGPQTVDRLLVGWSRSPDVARSLLLHVWRYAELRREELIAGMQADAAHALSRLLVAQLTGTTLDDAATIGILKALAQEGYGPHSLADLNAMLSILRPTSTAASQESPSGTRTQTSCPAWMTDDGDRAAWLALEILSGSTNAELKSLPPAAIGTLPRAILEDLIKVRAVRTEQISDADLRDLRRLTNDPTAVPIQRIRELGQTELAGWVALSNRTPDEIEGDIAVPRRWTILASLAAGKMPPFADLGELREPLLVSLGECLQAGTWSRADPALLADDTVAPVLDRLEPPDEVPSVRGTLVGVERLRRAKSHLHKWDWRAAAAEARAALAAAPMERQRDEALNLLAAAQWQSGEPELAMAALNKALEGAYTDALLVNAGVVAAELDPTAAVEHFSRLAAEAPTTQERALAAERSVRLWKLDGDPWDDSGPPIPSALCTAMRELLKRSDLDPERWREILTLLAVHDDAWVAAASATALGPRGATPLARVLQGRAKGPEEWIGAMASALRGSLDPSDRTFLEQERDGLVGAVIQALIADDANLNAAGFALEIVDQDLPVDEDDGIALRALAAWVACKELDLEEQEPSDLIIRRAEEAVRGLPRLPADRRSEIQPVVEAARNAVATALLIARANEFDTMVDGYNGMLEQLRALPRWQVDRRAVNEVLDVCESFCTETSTLVGRAVALATEPDLKRALGDLRANVQDALRTAQETRRQL